MPEQSAPADPELDQSTAAARDHATVVARLYTEYRDRGVPRLERFVFTLVWLCQWVKPDDDECDCADD